MRPDRIFATVLALVAAGALAASLEMPMIFQGAPGPGLMPTAFSAFLLVLSLTQLFSRARGLPSSAEPAGDSMAGYVRCLIAVALSALFILLIGTVGYVPATAVLVAGILGLVYKQRALKSLAAGVLFGGGSYVLFANVLAVQLPAAFPAL